MAINYFEREPMDGPEFFTPPVHPAAKYVERHNRRKRDTVRIPSRDIKPGEEVVLPTTKGSLQEIMGDSSRREDALFGAAAVFSLFHKETAGQDDPTSLTNRVLQITEGLKATKKGEEDWKDTAETFLYNGASLYASMQGDTDRIEAIRRHLRRVKGSY